jgi:hypothetical protein
MRESNESYVASQNESDRNGSYGRVRMSHAQMGVYVLCVFLLLDECMEGDVYGFGVEDVEITEVAKKAKITKVAKMAKYV